ncbi:DNA cytosine methyltransferase [Paraburkholderia sediminicola]|uniref:DNA cytosine methyltransferase n=1 Tax=Paraburkholderia sediminicola TaxID=458836 RepID=UPI0038BC35C9
MAKKEIWSFFTGAMGLDLGLEKVGLHPTLANELDAACCETIRLNRPGLTLLEEDVSELNAKRLRKERNFDGDVFLMVGGPPCQTFSSGGKRSALSDRRGNLVYEYLRLIDEVRPKYFIFENVANFTTAALQHRPIAERPGQHWSLKRYEGATAVAEDGCAPMMENELSGSAIREVLEVVRQLDYHVNFGVLDSADYGAPQHRLRFVMVGSRDRPAPKLPKATHGLEGTDLQSFQTVRDAIWHLRADPGPGSLYTDAVRRFFALVPEGKNWRALPEALKREAMGGSYEAGGGKTGFYRRLAWDRPAPTITGRANRKGSALCHPEEVRPLSTLECAAIQGFPPSWEFSGSMNTQYQQIGNAVPVELGAALGLAIKNHRPARSTVIRSNYDEMLEIAVKRLRSAARNKRPVATTTLV